MMMAMWPGTAPCTRSRCSRSLLIRSDFQDLRFLRMNQPIDLLDVLVGELLDLLFGVPLVVFGDLLELLDTGQRVGPGVPHRNAPFLTQLMYHFHQIPTTFLRQG